MIAEKGSKPLSIKDRIKDEVAKISAHPLTYSALGLCDAIEDFELDDQTKIDDYNSNMAALQVLGFVIDYDFVNAKHAWKRIPESVKKDDKLKSILTILKGCLKDAYADIIPSIQVAQKVYQGNAEILSLLGASIHSIRAHIIRMLNRDFANIAVKEAARYLTLNADETVDILTKSGWEIMADQDFIKAPQKILISDKEFRQLTEAQFKNLSNTIGFLETI
mmetsp:Transcript_5125/g.4347  ORF Transcript_5125/g.4347 Transcript_5125/m.4347 type:complete len:221 (+) Transcript_5125:59-721(+)